MNLYAYARELKTTCTGCGTCSQKCPCDAIEMKKNEEGFSYPVIDNTKCIDCGLCVKSCPQIDGGKNHKDTMKYYAAMGADDVRPKGSSGGVFPTIASSIIEENGVVFGASFINDCKSVQIVKAETLDELNPLFKSKYVQSDTASAYKEVEKELKSGKKVLFSACPCQVDGLYNYLGHDYENLVTVDILCHGAPSPLAYERFIEELSEGKKAVNVDFRDKTYGWGTLIKASFDDGSEVFHHWDGIYFKAFLSGLIIRESCYQCKYACQKRVGDITLGDFWNVKTINERFDDRQGTSIIAINSDKGFEFINVNYDKFKLLEEVDNKETYVHQSKYNAAIARPLPKPQMRKCFFKHIAKGDTLSKSYRYSQKSIMDIGILGWWIETKYSNFGSTLTDYALYTYLEDQGYSVAMVSPPNFDRDNAGDFNKKNNYRMTAKYTENQMPENNKYFDGYVVASDVLWYYDAMIKSGYMFMLDFADDKKIKVSYSTSFGNTRGFIPDSELPKAKYLLKRFDAVSTREFEGVDICNEKFDIKATQVMDPVFLSDMKNWTKLEGRAERRETEKYIFAYYLDPNDEKVTLLKRIAEENNLKIVSITDKQTKTEEKQEILKDCGVLKEATIDEFIYHLKNAECVLTDSFHGMCFSLIFNKPFYTFVNTIRGASRFETLSKIAGVDDRLIWDNKIELDVVNIFKIDYKKINKRLDKKIQESKIWLEEAISTKKTIEIDSETVMAKDIYDLKKKVEDLESKIARIESKE